jgi:hypothetical protein
MDIISALIDCANIAMEIAGTGKTGNARQTARNAMFAQLNTFLGPQQRHLHDLYDDETQNGTIATAQQDWDDNFVTKVVEEWQAQGGPEFRVT